MSIATRSFFSPESLPFPVRRFTVEEYHRLGEIGVLTPDDQVELLEGWIVEKMNHRPAHGFMVRILNDWFQSNIPAGWILQCQLPITLQFSEPEPDLAVIRGKHRDFQDRHPGGADCRLVIEVADSSLSRDRAKAAIYAAAEVEEYWIVNILDKTIERWSQPDHLEYEKTGAYGYGDHLKIGLDDQIIELRLDDLF